MIESPCCLCFVNTAVWVGTLPCIGTVTADSVTHSVWCTMRITCHSRGDTFYKSGIPFSALLIYPIAHTMLLHMIQCIRDIRHGVSVSLMGRSCSVTLQRYRQRLVAKGRSSESPEVPCPSSPLGSEFPDKLWLTGCTSDPHPAEG